MLCFYTMYMKAGRIYIGTFAVAIFNICKHFKGKPLYLHVFKPLFSVIFPDDNNLLQIYVSFPMLLKTQSDRSVHQY